MKKILVIFGTRPEAIKLAPIVNELKKRPTDFELIVCVTGQHREMLDQVLNLFEIEPDYDLNVMSENQDLFDVTGKILLGLKEVFVKEQPDLVLVQGDTTTAFVGSLAAFYFKVSIGHVEAGLRTYNKYHPFPEEKNRHMVAVLADYHFAPTDWAKENLINEGILEETTWVTGNTGIDALLSITKKMEGSAEGERWKSFFLDKWNLDLNDDGEDGKIILVTAHRRENFGEGFQRICMALREIASKNRDAKVVYPVHLNPNVRKPVSDILQAGEGKNQLKNIYLLEPLDYAPFVYLMNKSYLILTDSGGVQEEAPSLGKPVLVMRDTTERPEGVEAGTVKLVGTSRDDIVEETQKLMDDPDYYKEMSTPANPYGDGKSAERIVNILGVELFKTV
jgi:UDP-N-acetylglucosamine 2-epimerase (non-hydrolysing)